MLNLSSIAKTMHESRLRSKSSRFFTILIWLIACDAMQLFAILKGATNSLAYATELGLKFEILLVSSKKVIPRHPLVAPESTSWSRMLSSNMLPLPPSTA